MATNIRRFILQGSLIILTTGAVAFGGFKYYQHHQTQQATQTLLKKTQQALNIPYTKKIDKTNYQQLAPKGVTLTWPQVKAQKQQLVVESFRQQQKGHFELLIPTTTTYQFNQLGKVVATKQAEGQAKLVSQNHQPLSINNWLDTNHYPEALFMTQFYEYLIQNYPTQYSDLKALQKITAESLLKRQDFQLQNDRTITFNLDEKTPVTLKLTDLTAKKAANKPTDDTSEKVVALTFDDGPTFQFTEKIVAILKAQNVPATFFMLGQNVETMPQLAKLVASQQYEIASHSYDHQYLPKLSDQDALADVLKTDLIFKKHLNQLPTLERPPFGATDTKSANFIGKPIIQWDVDSKDWETHDAKQIVKNVMSNVHNGGIILMHENHAQSVAALPEVINQLKAKGYTFKTISQLYDQAHLKPGYQYFGQHDFRKI